MDASPELFLHRADNTRICYQTFGSPSNPAILLLAGGAQSMLAWPDDFVRMLSPASDPHFVIRYDIRDTGRSTCYAQPPDFKGPYTISDLADDALTILDEVGIESAHLVGFSMGGGIAFTVAGMRAPHRVKSMALLSSSPVGPSPRPEDGLPGISQELMAKIGEAPTPSDWHDRKQVVDFLTYFYNCMAHLPAAAEEQAEAEALFGRVWERAEANGTEVWTFFNQQAAAHAPWPRRALPAVKCPTVVIHGRHDINVPVQHAELLAKEIPGAKLVVVDNIAHELPRRVWQLVVAEVLEVAAKA